MRMRNRAVEAFLTIVANKVMHGLAVDEALFEVPLR